MDKIACCEVNKVTVTRGVNAGKSEARAQREPDRAGFHRMEVDIGNGFGFAGQLRFVEIGDVPVVAVEHVVPRR